MSAAGAPVVTYPITPNPAIHTQPQDIGKQRMLYSGGQLSSWAKSLPLAMTLQLMDAILKALGVSQTEIDALNNDATNYYNAVQTNLNALQTAWNTLQEDNLASRTAFGTFLTSVQSAITGYTNWSTFVTAVESAWNTYTTTESNLASDEIFTIQNFLNSLLGIDTTTGQMAGTNVTGAGGQFNVIAAIEAGWDQLVQAFTGKSTTGNGLGQLANAASGTAAQAAYAQEVAQAATAVQAQQATAKPGYMAIDSTMDAVFPLSHMLVAPTYLAVTAASTALGYICVPDNVAKLSVAWVGYYTGTISGLYINVYSMNATTGALTKVEASSSIIGSVGTASSWNYYDLPTPITANVGDWYAVEMVVTGSGTYSLMGVPSSTVPQNGVVYPRALGALRPITPAHDAVGGGSYPTGTGSTFSWSHTLGSSATAILIEIALTGASSAPPPVSSVTVGGVAATLLCSTNFLTGNTGTAYIYQLVNPPVGTQTIKVTTSAATYFAGNSDSYSGVQSIGTANTNSGNSSGTASVSVTSATGQLAVAAIISANSISSFNQTTAWTGGTTSGAGFFGVGGYAAGASSVTFSASAGGGWAAMGVSLIGGSSTAPASIASPTYSVNIPWFGLGASAVDNNPVYAPEPHSYYTNGSYTLTVPSWAVYADAIALGAGGGAGGGLNGAGSNGANTTVTVGTNTVTGTGGVAGAGGTTTTPYCYGYSPGNETYNGQTYYGGAQVGLGQNGSSPGGGGGGSYYGGLVGHAGGAGTYSANTYTLTGISTITITVGAGGLENNIGGSPSYGAAPGADGAAWIVFRQS